MKTKKILLIINNFRIIICLLMFVGRVAKEKIFLMVLVNQVTVQVIEIQEFCRKCCFSDIHIIRTIFEVYGLLARSPLSQKNTSNGALI